MSYVHIHILLTWEKIFKPHSEKPLQEFEISMYHIIEISFLGEKNCLDEVITWTSLKQKLTRISTRKSLRCSLNAGMSWSKLNNPWTVILIWLSERCGKAALSSLATNSWTYSLLSGTGPSGTWILPSSTNVNIYARIVACIVRPAINKKKETKQILYEVRKLKS